MSLYASIDIGSNTLRLLIGEIKDNRIYDICYKRTITRLGLGILQTGKLHDTPIEASIGVLKDFSSLISSYHVKHVKAVATSAIREASNADIFIQRVLAETGISIQVISGQQEAELTLKGILSSLTEHAALIYQSFLIIDMGGGSTEWICYKNKQCLDKGSIPTGVIKLYGQCIKTDPVSKTDISKLNNEIVPHIHALAKHVARSIDTGTRLIGTAGTFTTLAAIDLELDTYEREKIHLHRLSLSTLHKISHNLFPLVLEARKNVRGLEPERADLIIPGIQFTIKLMEIFHFNELIVSDYGLLEGVLLDII
jgi:exopolyphosphatase/guanosine-5'-triphosphate,3'-diphosphate pyrophosphatase